MEVQDLPSWNQSEFLAFTLLYCAHVDMQYDALEKKMIQSLLPKENYIKVRDHFRSCNDAECLRVIEGFKGLHYPTIARRDELLDMAKKLFASDGEFATLEKVVFGQLQRIL